MPALTIDDDAPAGREVAILLEPALDLFKHLRFGLLPFAVHAVQLRGQLPCAGYIAGGEELNHIGGYIHAAGCIDAGRNAEAEIAGGDRSLSRVELGDLHQCAQTGARRAMELLQTNAGENAILAQQRHRVGNSGR